MGETAENVAKQWNISRLAQDEFALQSQEKYFAALEKQKWKEEIVGVEILGGKEEKIFFDKDEHPRQNFHGSIGSFETSFRQRWYRNSG